MKLPVAASLWLCVLVLSSQAAWFFSGVHVWEKEGNWTLTNNRLEVRIEPAAGRLTVRDRSSGAEWVSATAFQNVRQSKKGICFDKALGHGQTNRVTITLSLPDRGADLFVEADMTDRTVKIHDLSLLEPFVCGSTNAALVVADYANGHLYPLDLKPFPRMWLANSQIDMPWVGVSDLVTGCGYSAIVEAPAEFSIVMTPIRSGNRECLSPRISFYGSKGEFRYPRRCFYHFASSGGYVALAKRFRDYARELGLIVPFAEKVKRNPNTARLFGAPDVWGDATLKFAQEAKAAGVEKMLIHGRTSAGEMKAINDLGYLTSNYDNYTDILPIEPGKGITHDRGRLPDDAVLKADGTRMTAWITFDKKVQYMKRCPALWVPAAKEVIPKDLQEHPFLGRFIDVTTAESPYECFDPNHPLTSATKIQCGVDLLSYVKSLGLIVGGEHGRWWAVPQLDYIEGMMSGLFYSWPSGHLIRPKSKDQEFTGPWGKEYGKWADYEKFGIGHEYRIPLWELVFHDCVVSTWYWGDASDFLLTAAPEVTPKKDAFNVLYGTIPLLWANKEGSWRTERDTFLRTYRNTCKLHEVIAGTEMLTHEFLTADRAVQRTKFSDGTEVMVNFGERPFEAKLAGKKYLLPQNGFAVKGPRIEQSRSLVDGKPQTVIRAGKYTFTESR